MSSKYDLKLKYGKAQLSMTKDIAEIGLKKGAEKIANCLHSVGAYIFLERYAMAHEVLSGKERHRLLMMAQASKEVQAISEGYLDYKNGELIEAAEDMVSCMVNQARGNITAQEVHKQFRLNKVAALAEEKLSSEDDSNISDEPIDLNWFNSFRSYVENSSNEGLEEVWASILAGETKEPGTYSLRTFSFISHLTKDEAVLVERVLPLITHRQIFCLQGKNQGYGLSEYLTVDELLELQSMGLITGIASDLGVLITIKPKSAQTLAFGGYGISLVNETEKVLAMKLDTLGVTAVGMNLRSALSKIGVNTDYMVKLRNHLSRRAPKGVSVELSRKSILSDGSVVGHRITEEEFVGETANG